MWQKKWPSSLPGASSICPAGRRFPTGAQTCPDGSFSNSDSPACIILRVGRAFWTEVASRRLHFSRSSTDRVRAVQRAAWAWNSVWLWWEIFYKHLWPAGLRFSAEWCCLARKPRATGRLSPGKTAPRMAASGPAPARGTVTPGG